MAEGFTHPKVEGSLTERTRTIQGHQVAFVELDTRQANALAERLAKIALVQEGIRSYLNDFISFLKLPVVIDDFAVHNERRPWRDALPQGDLDEMNANVLKANRMGGVLQAFEAFPILFPLPTEEGKAQLAELIRSAEVLKGKLEEYKAIDQNVAERGADEKVAFEDKMRFVTKVRSFVELATQGLIKLYATDA
jgi:hypothetical protein